jgi:hypothetical protein
MNVRTIMVACDLSRVPNEHQDTSGNALNCQDTEQLMERRQFKITSNGNWIQMAALKDPTAG